jgi:hypothetical protein
VLERYEGAPVELVGPHRKYLELETSAADDDGQPFVTPTVIYRYARSRPLIVPMWFVGGWMRVYISWIGAGSCVASVHVFSFLFVHQ